MNILINNTLTYVLFNIQTLDKNNAWFFVTFQYFCLRSRICISSTKFFTQLCCSTKVMLINILEQKHTNTTIYDLYFYKIYK